ncbi:Golgi transport complex subunit 3, variant 2 [Basidiobolus ranarum]|uniref:Conserved oligomeric Golgi complex subunit 3 n=1 Tax=Basidiobolus ranarum TaxID=34480 RepID=A0ABR2W1V1_9FUNG
MVLDYSTQNGLSETWEKSLVLSDVQNESILQLEESCLELPWPAEHLVEPLAQTLLSINNGIKKPGTPIYLPRSSSALSLQAEIFPSSTKMAAGSIGIKEPIENTQQFLDWFAKMETEMEREQEDVYRAYLETTSFYRNSCDELLEKIQNIKQLLEKLAVEYKTVEGKTGSVHQACERLLEEQENFMNLSVVLEKNLSHFNELESFNRLFNSPNSDICLQPEFIQVLTKIDGCLEYVSQNSEFRETELYAMRFRQCMSRGLSLIRSHVIETLKSLNSEPSKQNKPSTHRTGLFNVRLRATAKALKPLINEIEIRLKSYPDYESLLEDCQHCYLSVRQQMLYPIVAENIRELVNSDSDILDFTRNSCAYIMSLSAEEYHMFHEFYTAGDEALYKHLEGLVNFFYDRLRPQILKEVRIETLSELSHLLKIYLMEDMSGIDMDREGQAFRSMVIQILEDSQDRLVTQAQAFTKTEIQAFSPKPQDLNYPYDIPSPDQPSESVTLQVQLSTELPSDDPSSPAPTTCALDMPSTLIGLYPTFYKTFWIISKLFRAVKDITFEDLLNEIIIVACGSFLSAAKDIQNEKSSLDAKLFLIKHLVSLKDYVSSFDTESSSFRHTPTRSSSQSSSRKSSLLSPIIGLTSLRSQESENIDGREELDKCLKETCESFVSLGIEGVIDSINGLSRQLSQGQPMETQDGVLAEEILSKYQEFRKAIEERVYLLGSKLEKFLHDVNLEKIFLNQVKVLNELTPRSL